MAAIAERLRSGLVEVKERGDDGVFTFDEEITSRWDINQLRTAMFDKVPVLAINSATITRNDTGMQPAQLLLTAGYVVLDDRQCRGCASARFQLKVAVDPKEPRAQTFYAQDLVSMTPGVSVMQPLQPILVLQPGEQIEAEFEAIRGVGANNSKFFPVNVVRNPAEKDTGKQHLHLESRGAYTPIEIYDMAVQSIVEEYK